MTRIFAVVRSRGAAWDATLPLEEQRDWAAHAAFMDALADAGFIVAGGPLEGTPDVLLIVRADNADEMRSRLAGDPWGSDLLSLTRIAPWQIRLGSLR